VRILIRLLAVVASIGVVVAGSVVAVSSPLADLREAQGVSEPELDLARLDEVATRSYVYGADGSLVAGIIGVENRAPVTLAQVPQPVVAAILAVEDDDFYEHGGVNLRATARALLENVSEGGVVQGGSTITQQLVKNAYLDPERQIDRKVDEAAMAIRLEEQLSKDEILEHYLNTIYFGNGAYGVQAAAETYWGVDVGALGWAEGAMLAALISNPSANDPIANPETARRQRESALERLVQTGHLTPDESRWVGVVPLPEEHCGDGDPEPPPYPGAPPVCGAVNIPPPESYFVEDVKQALLNDPRYGTGATLEERTSSVFDGGLRIYTTLDPAAQRSAEEAIGQVVPDTGGRIYTALAAVDSRTGAVRAMVGGPGYEEWQFNIATHPPGSQVGSSFKTFTLLTALEAGAVPADTVDGATSFRNPGGEPDPYPVKGKGGSLTSVTASSSNAAYVRLSLIYGRDEVAQMARRLGITTPIGETLNMTLGVSTVTPLEMASAYSAIPNGGLREPSYLIERVEDAAGNVLYQHLPSATRAVTTQTACLAAEVLEANVKSGTGTRAQLDRQPAAGKTGTTDDNYDAWFVGFTPYLTTAVWMGDPRRETSMSNVGGVANYGGTYPAMVWGDFNERFHGGLDPQPFPECESTRRGTRLKTPTWATTSSGSSRSSSTDRTDR
jgi:penicillin-binding protein 1A